MGWRGLGWRGLGERWEVDDHGRGDHPQAGLGLGHDAGRRFQAGDVEPQALVLGLGGCHLGLEPVDRGLALSEQHPHAHDGEQPGARQPGEGTGDQPPPPASAGLGVGRSDDSQRRPAGGLGAGLGIGLGPGLDRGLGGGDGRGRGAASD